jgi:putative ABC transport system ATP-binding protein
MLVELRDVAKEYRLGKQLVPALRGVSLSVAQGEFAVIAGPSGSGKTTLLNLIGCMDIATRGSITVDGESVNQLSERQLTEFRLRKLGFIFQNFNLVPVLTAGQNVELPLLLQNRMKAAERKQRVTELLGQVGLTDFANHKPKELSGGQQQRVAIARALVKRPKLVLADEPTANLDSVTGDQIVRLMRDISRSEGATFIFSTHDPRIIAMAERIIEVSDGLILRDESKLNASAPKV